MMFLFHSRWIIIDSSSIIHDESHRYIIAPFRWYDIGMILKNLIDLALVYYAFRTVTLIFASSKGLGL